MNASVIVPVFNEQENIAPLCREIKSALEGTVTDYEIIFVDDASTDRSAQVLSQMEKQDPSVTVVKHPFNQGQGKSISTGVNLAKYDFIMTLDADLQNDPGDLKVLIGKKSQDVNMVTGIRKNRHDSWVKKTQSLCGNSFFRFLFKHSANDIGCGIKIFDKKAFEKIEFSHNVHRYLPILFHLHGYKVLDTCVNHRPRMQGKSKYGLRRFFHVGRDLILLLRYKRHLKQDILA